MNANSFEGSLVITSVGTDGKLAGTVFGNRIEGFWDGDAQKVTFLRVPPGASNHSAVQVYTGFLFRNPPEPGAGDNVTYTLCGSFEAFAGTGAAARRTVFGWFAQRTIVG